MVGNGAACRHDRHRVESSKDTKTRIAARRENPFPPPAGAAPLRRPAQRPPWPGPHQRLRPVGTVRVRGSRHRAPKAYQEPEVARKRRTPRSTWPPLRRLRATSEPLIRATPARRRDPRTLQPAPLVGGRPGLTPWPSPTRSDRHALGIRRPRHVVDSVHQLADLGQRVRIRSEKLHWVDQQNGPVSESGYGAFVISGSDSGVAALRPPRPVSRRIDGSSHPLRGCGNRVGTVLGRG